MIFSLRGPRATAEAALKHCTLQDTTFLRPLELLGPRRGILGMLSAITDPLDARATGQQACVDGFVEARTHLYRLAEGCGRAGGVWGGSWLVRAGCRGKWPMLRVRSGVRMCEGFFVVGSSLR